MITVELCHHDNLDSHGYRVALPVMPRTGELLDIFGNRFMVATVLWRVGIRIVDPPVVALEPVQLRTSAEDWAREVAEAYAIEELPAFEGDAPDAWKGPPIGKKLRKERIDAGLSLRAVAAQSLLTGVALGEIERGRTNPDAIEVATIRKAIADMAKVLEHKP